MFVDLLSFCVFACANKIICAKMNATITRKNATGEREDRITHVENIYSPHKYAHHHGVVIYCKHFSLFSGFQFHCSVTWRIKNGDFNSQQYSDILVLFSYFLRCNECFIISRIQFLFMQKRETKPKMKKKIFQNILKNAPRLMIVECIF